MLASGSAERFSPEPVRLRSHRACTFTFRTVHDDHGRGPRRDGRPIPLRTLSWSTYEGRQGPQVFGSRRISVSDQARKTGPALEAHYQFLAWLMPAAMKFPRIQKFLLGDRIQTTALDILDALIEATYTRDRRVFFHARSRSRASHSLGLGPLSRGPLRLALLAFRLMGVSLCGRATKRFILSCGTRGPRPSGQKPDGCPAREQSEPKKNTGGWAKSHANYTNGGTIGHAEAAR